jgi:putative endonuclease
MTFAVILRSEGSSHQRQPFAYDRSDNGSMCATRPFEVRLTPRDTGAMREYHVYIMTNNSGTLYVGVTGDLQRRVAEHKLGAKSGFTSRYKLTRLVYVESTTDARAAIEREKQIKGWLRRRKIELIATQNPKWKDLSEGEYAGNVILRNEGSSQQRQPFA